MAKAKKAAKKKPAKYEAVDGTYKVIAEVAGCAPGYIVGNVSQCGDVCRATFVTGPRIGLEILVSAEVLEEV